MAKVTDVDELSQEAVDQSLSLIQAMLQEQHPELDVAASGLVGLLLRPGAELAAAAQEDFNRYLRSSSLKQILADPINADTEMVDIVMSNYGLTRQPGSLASGKIAIVVSKKITTTVPAGSVFVGGTSEFRTEVSYSAKTSSVNVDSDTDSVLVALSDGNFKFTIPVVALQVGSASLLKQGTLLTTTAPIPNVVRIYADEDFIDGVDEESNSQLIARQAEGIAAKTVCNRINCAALLRDVSSNYVALSIIGAGDKELLRDKHSIFPGSFGGRSDWYFRDAADIAVTQLELECVLHEKTSDGYGIWQCDIDRDTAPGFYDVSRVVPADTAEYEGSLTVTEDIRGFNTQYSDGELLPDIETAVEAVFSRYQTAVIRFKDTTTLTAGLTVAESTKSFLVSLRVSPKIAEVQTAVSNRGTRFLFGDVLVKAPIPCFVSISFSLLGRPSAELPNVDAIKTAIVNYVNGLSFTGHLFASDITRIIHSYLPSGVSVSAIDMLGKLLKPNGETQTLHSREVLEIPDDSVNMVSARTVGFVTYKDLVLVSAGAINVPEII